MIDPNTSLDRGTRAEKTFAQRMIEWADPDSLQAEDADRAGPGRAETPGRRAERAIAAALRSLAGRPVTVTFSGGEPGLDGPDCRLPRLADEPEAAEIAALRGLGDAAALFLRHHDARLHERLAPRDARARVLFDRLERARCEARGSRLLPGVAGNLAAAADRRLQRLGLAGQGLAGQWPVAEALALVLGWTVGRVRPAALPQAVVAIWQAWLAEQRGGFDPEALADRLADQAAFAVWARPLAEALAPRLPAAPAAVPRRPRPDDLGDPAPLKTPGRRVAAEEGETAEAPEAGGGQARGEAAPVEAEYRVFTRRHDRVVEAAELAGGGELEALRQRLDREAAPYRAAVSRLANRLQRKLLAAQRRDWEFDREEGLLDAGRLARVVATPGQPLSFKVERDSAFRDTVVALLIDNSGSMRGRSILLATLTADILARALERCGVKTEILGFTTRAFRGGDSLKDWARAGRPARPGRLSDLLHIVYKPADAPYRRARAALAAALKPDLLKENVDGEALEWAHARLLARPEARKILVVLSDGAPADEATLRHNAPLLLDAHLHRVVAAIERQGAVELRAIGIGHDVRRHYGQAVTLKDARSLAATLVDQLDRVFDDQPDRRRARA